MTMGEMVKEYQDKILDQVEELENRLYVEATESSKTPAGSVRYLKKLKSELPDSYSGTTEEVVRYALSAKAIDDVISAVYKSAMDQEWGGNQDD